MTHDAAAIEVFQNGNASKRLMDRAGTLRSMFISFVGEDFFGPGVDFNAATGQSRGEKRNRR